MLTHKQDRAVVRDSKFTSSVYLGGVTILGGNERRVVITFLALEGSEVPSISFHRLPTNISKSAEM